MSRFASVVSLAIYVARWFQKRITRVVAFIMGSPATISAPFLEVEKKMPEELVSRKAVSKLVSTAIDTIGNNSMVAIMTTLKSLRESGALKMEDDQMQLIARKMATEVSRHKHGILGQIQRI
jgi:hypothetical protein